MPTAAPTGAPTACAVLASAVVSMLPSTLRVSGGSVDRSTTRRPRPDTLDVEGCKRVAALATLECVCDTVMI